jgi:hypothetical protein
VKARVLTRPDGTLGKKVGNDEINIYCRRDGDLQSGIGGLSTHGFAGLFNRKVLRHVCGASAPAGFVQDEETYYRGQVMGIWTRPPAPGREKCSELASQSERAKYEVLSRCLRAAISEAAWKDVVGTIKP